MQANRAYEIPGGRNVAYFRDYHQSIPAQVQIAENIGGLLKGNGRHVVACETGFGIVPNLVEKIAEAARYVPPHIFLEDTWSIGERTSSIHLLQLKHQKGLKSGKFQIYGIEDREFLYAQRRLHEEYKALQKINPRSRLELKMSKARISWLEGQLTELNARREDADARNIWRLMNAKNLALLPLVLGTDHHDRMRLLLRYLYNIGTITYDFASD
ncbi:hypothetical protein HYX08_04805 [Candidatus Woesearchaeota archaeon]|nr:hypothetical protein [Candidatus Woesearchaeota archaeon]